MTKKSVEDRLCILEIKIGWLESVYNINNAALDMLKLTIDDIFKVLDKMNEGQ